MSATACLTASVNHRRSGSAAGVSLVAFAELLTFSENAFLNVLAIVLS